MSINKKPAPPVDVINENSGPSLTNIGTRTSIGSLPRVDEQRKGPVEDDRLKRRKKLHEVPTKKRSR
jgi:hypothetical protein